MILKVNHRHHVKQQQTNDQVAKENQRQPECPQFLQQLLKQTQKIISNKSKKQISTLSNYIQKKVYQSFAQEDINYIAVMFQKANPSQQKYVKQLMTQREDSIMDKIVKQQILIKQAQPNDTKIKRIKNQLDQKIKQMKKEIGDFTGSNDEQKESLLKSRMNNSIILLEDFKKKQYWKDKSYQQENKRIRSFISLKKKQKSQLQEKFNSDLQSRFKKLNQIQEKQKNKIKQQKQKDYLQNLQKQYKQKALKRKQYFQRKQQKKQQIKNFLEQIKSKQPTHIRFQKDFKDFIAKQQQQRERILKQIKQKHPTYNAEQVEQHMNRYIQHKKQYEEQKQMKAEMQQEILSQRFKQIKSLYHSKFHNQIRQSKKLEQMGPSSLVSNRKKVWEYAKTVKQSFKPQVDRRKRQQVLETIKLLQLSNDPTKRKVIKGNGIIEFEDKKQNDRYQKGVLYLEQLRSFNQVNKSRISESRKQRSSSALQLSTSAPKKIDYLRQSRPQLQLKPTISDWKQLLKKKSFSNRDKVQRVLDRAQSLQIYSKQKEVQLRNMKKNPDILDIRQESDRYYLESIAARMVLLKDVVMK